MILSSHRLAARMRLFAVVFYGLAAVAVPLMARQFLEAGDARPLVFLGVWVVAVLVQGGFLLLRMPQRIDVLDTGLRFTARTRTVEVPWPALRSVGSLPLDLNQQTLRWRWDGGTIWTWRQYDDLRALLNQVEQRAPHATLKNV